MPRYYNIYVFGGTEVEASGPYATKLEQLHAAQENWAVNGEPEIDTWILATVFDPDEMEVDTFDPDGEGNDDDDAYGGENDDGYGDDEVEDNERWSPKPHAPRWRSISCGPTT